MSKVSKVLFAFMALMSVSTLALAEFKLTVAPRKNHLERHYFDGKGNEVGAEIYYCSGSYAKWGTEAEEVITSGFPCP